MEKCIECKERPIQIKKRKLCYRCYGRLRARGTLPELSTFRNTPIYHIAEMDFIKNYFTHDNWIYQPANFRLDGIKYSPDFYDGKTNTFIEVSGSRQAYHISKNKYELFRKLFPLIKIEIRTPDGDLLQKDSNGIFIWNKHAKMHFNNTAQ